jgi:2-polyprenyl-6-methoxyphenol hydroxylase-like FAD-dependent oxidoreductase
MRGERKYRLILIPKENNNPSEKSEIALSEFNSILQTLSGGKIRAEDATWLTRFRVHHRLVEHFQKGRIFLAGDAAHIHSPAVGQGMNTGIQDALNLAHKLKRFFDGKISLESLEDYERERLPVAKNVVHGTDFVFKMALLPETKYVGWIRSFVLPFIARSSFIQRRVAEAISQVNVARREIRGYE